MPKANEKPTAQQSNVVCLETNDRLRFRVLFEKEMYLCLEQYLFIAQQNKNYLRVHTVSDNTGIG